MRYLRHSKYVNENYVSSDCSFSIIDKDTFKPFYFTGERHGNFDSRNITIYKDRFFQKDKYTGTTEYEIYEEYETEKEYMEAIDKYLLMRELVS